MSESMGQESKKTVLNIGGELELEIKRIELRELTEELKKREKYYYKLLKIEQILTEEVDSWQGLKQATYNIQPPESSDYQDVDMQADAIGRRLSREWLGEEVEKNLQTTGWSLKSIGIEMRNVYAELEELKAKIDELKLELGETSESITKGSGEKNKRLVAGLLSAVAVLGAMYYNYSWH